MTDPARRNDGAPSPSTRSTAPRTTAEEREFVEEYAMDIIREEPTCSRIIKSLLAERDAFEAALREIAARPCTALVRGKDCRLCSSCIARKALGEQEDGK